MQRKFSVQTPQLCKTVWDVSSAQPVGRGSVAAETPWDNSGMCCPETEQPHRSENSTGVHIAVSQCMQCILCTVLLAQNYT